jgi:hypothetical protein
MSASTFSTVGENVRGRTNGEVSEEIRRNLRRQLSCYASADSEEISRRLQDLDREWSLERVAQAGASGAILFWIAMSLLRRRFLVIPALVAAGFLLQAAITGWNPPMNLLRRLKLRTKAEIDEERYALKVLRGDFNDIPELPKNTGERINRVLEIVRR